MKEYGTKLSLGEKLTIIDSRQASKEFVKQVVIDRYPETFKKINELKDETPEAISKIFYYVRGIPIYKTDGSLDTSFANKMMLSPSASFQAIQQAEINKDSKILEVFSGTGYFTLFLSLYEPKELVCLDLNSPSIYNLPLTFENGLKYIFESDVKHTYPKWVMADATKNIPFSSQTFDVAFLHPPYGRGSKSLYPDLSESEAKQTWLDSIQSVRRVMKGVSSIISVVPTEWINSEAIPVQETKQFPLSIVKSQV